MGDCREGIPCNEQPDPNCLQCQECPPPGQDGCIAVRSTENPNMGTFYPWDQDRTYACNIKDVNKGTCTAIVLMDKESGQHIKVGVRLVSNRAELRHAKRDRKEYLEILDRHMGTLAAAWTATGKPYPKASYMEDETGQIIFFPPYYTELDCTAEVLSKHGSKAKLRATFQSGRGWAIIKDVQHLTQLQFSRDFMPLRFEYVGKRKEAIAAAKAEWKEYEENEGD